MKPFNGLAWSISSIVIFILLFIASRFFLSVYLIWVYFGLNLLLIGLSFVGISFFSPFNNVERKAKQRWVRVGGVASGALLIVWYCCKRDLFQTVQVNDMKLLNTHRGLYKHQDKAVEYFFLPKSKFIVKFREK